MFPDRGRRCGDPFGRGGAAGQLVAARWPGHARVAAGAAVVFVLASVVDPNPLYPEYPDVGSPIGVPPWASRRSTPPSPPPASSS
jgi:hypothetical protein